MHTRNIKKGLAAGIIAAGLAAGAMVGTSASADPAQFSALVGVGSDTTQDVVNAFAGRAGTNFFTPLSSSSSTGKTQLISWDATGAGGTVGDCVIMKPGYGAYQRPNGSGNGRAALSRAIDGSGWGSAACGKQDVSGVFDFARSSSTPGSTGTASLVHIPFARDAVSFAYYRKAGSPVTSLTRGQLNQLFTGGVNSSITVGGVKIIACGIQSGSGTFSFWNGRTGASTTQEDDATKQCRTAYNAVNSALGGRLQENDGVDLKAAGDAVAVGAEANTQVIIGFSAGAFIAKSNGYASPTPPAGVGIGGISDDVIAGGGANLGNPVTGTAPNLAPVSSFYNSSSFGRSIYNVLPATVVDDAVPNAAQSMFVGSTSSVCSATATMQLFGFLPLSSGCGATTARTSLQSGTENA